MRAIKFHYAELINAKLINANARFYLHFAKFINTTISVRMSQLPSKIPHVT